MLATGEEAYLLSPLLYDLTGFPETDVFYGTYEHLKVVGPSYEGSYNAQMQFGMSVPEEFWSTNEDPKEGFHEDIDRLDGAVHTVEVTFADGSKEEHHYRLNTGKIYVPIDKDGRCLWDQLTRFLTEEESLGQTPYAYGYLMEMVD